MIKLTLNDFLLKAKEVHGNKYDYSKVIYKNNKTKIVVTCLIHGDFEIRPDCLLNGTGCPICGGTKKMTTEEFIRKSNIVHNNFFIYDKCVYKGSGEKVIVKCPYHSYFEVKANNHLNGANCEKCKKEHIFHNITKLAKVNRSTKKYDTKTFIEKAKIVHGNKFSYEKTFYEKNSKKVIITCTYHGDFEITPNHLLSGRGCPKCSKNYKMNTKEFIEKLKLIHGEKYDYSKVEYRSTHKPVIINCPKHGDFINSPANLLKGQGCPFCGESKLEKEINNILLKKEIIFERQKRFKWLRNENNLSLDFYLPDYNIAIECQGIQHFNSVSFFGGASFLEEPKKRDDKKRILCKENGINLLYYSDLNIDFPYEVITNINDLLKEIEKYSTKNLEK